jgi:hypothetical protein
MSPLPPMTTIFMTNSRVRGPLVGLALTKHMCPL